MEVISSQNQILVLDNLLNDFQAYFNQRIGLILGYLIKYQLLPILWWSSNPRVIDSTAVKNFKAFYLCTRSKSSVNTSENAVKAFLFWYLKYFPNFLTNFIYSGNCNIKNQVTSLKILWLISSIFSSTNCILFIERIASITF